MSSRFSSTGCCSQSAGCLCGLLPRTTGLPVVRCLAFSSSFLAPVTGLVRQGGDSGSTPFTRNPPLCLPRADLGADLLSFKRALPTAARAPRPVHCGASTGWLTRSCFPRPSPRLHLPVSRSPGLPASRARASLRSPSLRRRLLAAARGPRGNAGRGEPRSGQGTACNGRTRGGRWRHRAQSKTLSAPIQTTTIVTWTAPHPQPAGPKKDDMSKPPSRSECPGCPNCFLRGQARFDDAPRTGRDRWRHQHTRRFTTRTASNLVHHWGLASGTLD